jgi:hypothetical protein
MKRFLRLPSPAMVVAGVALFVSLGGVSYGLATGSIDSREIQDGSIRNRDFKDGTLRGQEAKRNGFGGGAIKESTLETVPRAAVGEGLAHHAVVGPNGALVRGRGVTSTSRTGNGQYQVVFDRDVRACAYVATIGDESAAPPGGGMTNVSQVATNANGVRVVTRNAGGAITDRSFHIVVSC